MAGPTSVEQEVYKLRAEIFGAPTDAPSTDAESGTARTGISLLKGIKNYLRTIAGAISGTKMLVTADPITGAVTVSGTATVDGTVAINNGAVVGPGNPTVDSLTSVKIDLAANTANQVLVAAVASHQIWVYGLFMMADTAAGTVTLQDEDDTALSGTMAVSDEGGWVLPMSGNFAMPWIKVATGKALECDTGAATIDGILVYGVVNP